MAHWQQQQFVEAVRSAFPAWFAKVRVLEIGSLDINGSVRSQFSDCAFIGLDVGAGPGVDVVCDGQDYAAPDGSFDTVISCEAMEHNPHWATTFDNMVRLVRSGGLIIMTCATHGRPEHGTTRTSPVDSPLSIDIGWEHYRNLSAKDFRRETRANELVGFFATRSDSHDLYFAGFKPPAPAYFWWAACRIRGAYYLRHLLHCVRSAKSISEGML